MSFLESFPSYRGFGRHCHPTKSAASTADCGQIDSNRHTNGLLDNNKDLTVSCKQEKYNSLSLNMKNKKLQLKLDHLV